MDDDPLSQLLSQHENETTILDQHFKKSIAHKIEKNNATLQPKDNSSRKTTEEDKSDEDNDQPIGLVHRQPSYTSLHGNLIGKDGVKVDRLPDLTEEGEETNTHNQNLDYKEPKPTKTSNSPKNLINQNNSFSSQDNVIAFDEHDDSEDVPIGLTYRQPSFSSMGDHLISKGGDSLADMPPLKTIPIEDAIIEEENEDNIQKITKEEEADNEEDEEDDENPQVQIVKDLTQRNKDRWLKMGYEPPPNLIQLTRAQSQSVFNQNQVFMQQPSTKSPLLFSPVQEEDENLVSSNKNHDYNRYEPSSQKSTINTTENTNSPLKPTTDRPKIAHRRCGSNGMKLGEASTSLARMSQALMIYDSNNKLPNTPEEYDNEEEEFPENDIEEEEDEDESCKDIKVKDEEEGKEEKEDTKKEKTKKHKNNDKKHKNKDRKHSKTKKQSKRNHKTESNSFAYRDLNEKKRTYLLPSESSSYDSDSEDNDYYYYHGNDELFGKLGQIVREDHSSDIYQTILTGNFPQNSNDNYPIKRRIQQYINTCINNLWVDETEYLSKIIDSTSKHHNSHKQSNRTNKNNYHFISHHQHHFSNHHHRKMKDLDPVERLKLKAADEDDMYETKIQETLLKQQHMLEMLNDEYKEEANDLDARYLIQTSPNRSNESEYDSDWSDSPAVLELKTTIRRLLKAKKYNAVQELSAKLKQLEIDEACEISEMIHEHYVNADRLLKERFAMRRALLLSKIQFELQSISQERENTAKRYSKSISRLKSLNIEIKELYALPENDDDQYDSDYDDYSSDTDLERYPKTLSRENDEKIIELMAEKMMIVSSSSDNDDYSDNFEKAKKKKKSKKNKDKKKDKKKKDKKEKKKKEKK